MSRQRVAVIAVAIVVMVAAPWFMFGVYVPGFVTKNGALDRSLCARSKLPVAPPPGRLTVVIVDGLGFDYAMRLPELGWMREAAAMRPLAVEYPSYTTPALLSFVTGVGPAESGVRLNASISAVTSDLDHLRSAAESVARPIDFFDGGWGPFGDIMFADGKVLWKGRRAMEASPFVSHKETGLRIVYFGDVDEAGHEHGEASSEFRLAAVRAARFLKRFFRLLDQDDRLLVVSDHGHLASGGHGGIEPEILRATFAILGRDARRGEVLEVRPIDDVAATIATLAGIPTPACNRGRPMLDVLDLDSETRAKLSAPALDQQQTLEAKIEPVHDTNKGLRFGLIALLTLGLGVFARRIMPPLASWFAPLSFAAGYLGYLALRGYRLTFSKMPQQPVFIADAIIGSIIGFALILGYLRWRKTEKAEITVLVGIVTPMLWMIAWVGIDTRIVPPPHIGLAAILWSPTQVAAALITIVLALRGVRRTAAT